MFLLVLSFLWSATVTGEVPSSGPLPHHPPLSASFTLSSLRNLSSPHDRGHNMCHEYFCKQPATLPVTQFEAVETLSPFHVTVLPQNNKTEQIDNVCYSFFETGGTTLLFYISTVFKNGSSEQWSYAKDDVYGRLGVLAGGNPTCMFREYAIELACQTTFILYRCFQYGSCGEFDAAIMPGVDVVVAVSAEPKVTDECKEEHMTMMRNAGFNDRGYVKLPQTLPYQCVTSLKGAPCVNAALVPPGNSISKP